MKNSFLLIPHSSFRIHHSHSSPFIRRQDFLSRGVLSLAVGAQRLESFPTKEERKKQCENRPRHIAERVAQSLNAVAEQFAERHINYDPQKLSRNIAHEKARPRKFNRPARDV